jgi:hypothetical protein
MPTFVYRDGVLVDKREAGPRNEKLGNASYVISDTMDPLRHMADGKMYDSKVKFRQATRAAGCVECGSETATLLAPRKKIELDRGQRRDAIRKTIYALRNR